MTNNKNDNEGTEFPGYPHYPAKEDIMNQKESERVDVDVENLSRSNTLSSSALPDKSVKIPPADKPVTPFDDIDDNETMAENNDADVTAEDLIALEGEDTDPAKVDLLEGENDLDVPGAEQDDPDEEIGEEDEENNYYSLGGDAHEALEEDQGA